MYHILNSRKTDIFALMRKTCKGIRIMKNWERVLLECQVPAVETITQSELESVIDECDTVPITARVVPDTSRCAESRESSDES